MHSSRADFSSLHTQHGFGLSVFESVVVVGFRSAARLFGGAGCWESRIRLVYAVARKTWEMSCLDVGKDS